MRRPRRRLLNRRQITLRFVLDYPTPAIASRIKTTRMAGFLDRRHYTGRVPAGVLAERMRATCSPPNAVKLGS